MTAHTQQRVIGLPVIRSRQTTAPLPARRGCRVSRQGQQERQYPEPHSPGGSVQTIFSPPPGWCRGTLCSRVCSTGPPEERYEGRPSPPWSFQPYPPCFLKIGPRKNVMFSKFPGYRNSAKGKPPHRFCSVRRFSFTRYSGIRTSTFGLWKITQAAPGPFSSGKQYQPRSGGYTSQTKSLFSAHSLHRSRIIWKVCSGAYTYG